MPKAEREAVASNAQAVLIAREKGGAAIAGQQTAKLYGMNILASNIEDDPNNTTRFLIIGKHDPTPTGDDVTSLVLTAQRNTPGALWQTPVADDCVDRAKGKWNSRGEPKLSGQVLAAHGGITLGSSATTEKPGALDPKFVAYLMGFPPSWLEVAPKSMPKRERK